MKQVNIRIPVRMLALIAGLFMTLGAFAQVNVQGHVKDSSGEPIIGATIRIVGQTGGVISDFDGNFTLSVQKGATLEVSYVGYQTAHVTASPSVVVTLQDDAQALENVVVIGYGRAKKSDLTGSVTAMKPDELSKGITTNAQDMLVGKIAGVNVTTADGTPGGSGQIRIRGGASLNASNDPLIVIDGLAIESNTSNSKFMSNPLAMVNPNDIETFTVLKDASATAIYGSRASNGVIIITTKKGRKGGSDNTRPQFVYNGDLTVSTIAKKYEVLSAGEFRSLIEKEMGEKGTAQLGNADTDWQDEIFRTSLSTSHNLSMMGVALGVPYRVSGGFNQQNGIVQRSWMRRANLGVNLSPSFFNDHLNFNIAVKYMAEKNSYPETGRAIGAALTMDPTQPVVGEGADYKTAGGFFQYMTSANFSDPSWTNMPFDKTPGNPVAHLAQTDRYAHADVFNGNIEMDYKVHGFEDLHIRANYGGEYKDVRQKTEISRQSFTNNYFGWNGHEYATNYSITANAFAQYMHEFGIHAVDIMAGAETSHFHRKGYDEGQGWDSYTHEAYNASLREETEWATHYSLLSYIGRLNYTLADRYMLTATLRADGSSRFAKGNKWGYFPAVALAWKINEEPFLKNVNWWNEMKLRLGWGKTGQQDINSDFGYIPSYYLSDQYAQYALGNTYYYTQRPGAYNPDLTWEKTTTYNAGLDFGFLNNRITLNVDAYMRKTTDLLNTVAIPVETNFSNRLTKNIGKMENYGVEASLSVKPVVTKDFTWDVTYNVAWNHNEITELTGGDDSNYYVYTGENISMGNNQQILINKVGYPANSFFVYQQVYDENGKPLEGVYVDRNADGVINSDDKYAYKDIAPDVTMGLTTKFLYKSWDLSLAFHASLNNYVYYDFLSSKANTKGNALSYSNSLHNTTAEAVALGFYGTSAGENWNSDYFVRNASYLKCSNITLGYSFPSLLTYAGIDYFSGRVYATVQNPFFITKYKGLDPEVSSGIDKNPYPRPLSIQMGVNLNF